MWTGHSALAATAWRLATIWPWRKSDGPRSAQHHLYRYCPDLLSPGALGISPRSLQASALQSSQSIVSNPGGSFLPSPQVIHQGHSQCQPHLTKTLLLMWSHYCISWTTPPGHVSGWSKVDPCRDDPGVGAILLT